MIRANERPHDWPGELAVIEAAWGDEVAGFPPTQCLDRAAGASGREADKNRTFAFDSLAVAATEFVAAEARVEPLWLSLIGAIGAVGLCAWAAFGQTIEDFHRLCPAGTAQSELCSRLYFQIAGTMIVQPEDEMRRKGCVMLTDRMLLSNPPQYDWLCPQK